MLHGCCINVGIPKIVPFIIPLDVIACTFALAGIDFAKL